MAALVAQRAAGQRRRGALVSCQGANSSSGSDGSASGDDASQHSDASPGSASSQRPIPWTLTFDIRERETIWTDENKVCCLAHGHAPRLVLLHTRPGNEPVSVRVGILRASVCCTGSPGSVICSKGAWHGQGHAVISPPPAHTAPARPKCVITL